MAFEIHHGDYYAHRETYGEAIKDANFEHEKNLVPVTVKDMNTGKTVYVVA